jgi:hypothetical protein
MATRTIAGLRGTLLYDTASWLRDASSFSRWDAASLIDRLDGRLVAEGPDTVQRGTLPDAFRLELALRHPEAVARSG